MNKQQTLAKLDAAWAGLKDSYAGLSNAQMEQPDVIGDWSVKEILWHVTAWEGEALKYLPVIREGQRPPRYSTMYGGIDAFNARMAEQVRGLSLSQVMAQFDDTHDRLVAYLKDAPEELFAGETPFRRRLALDTWRHYPIHARSIREWRG